MTPSAYSVRDLVFSYSDKPDLLIDTLDIAAGDVVALVGPNGSGKTTFLHLLAFILTPQQGSISLLGHDFQDSEAITFRRRIGLLPQNPYLFKATVLENVMVGLKLRKFPKHLMKKIAKEALSRVGMEGFEDRWPGTLSGGEAQRAALARTLALNPEVFLFDEPANHLDTESVKRTEQLIVDLNRRERKTVIFTTHDLTLAEEFANTVIHIFEGHVIPVAPFNLFRGQILEAGAIFDSGAIRFHVSNTVQSGSFILIDPRKISFTTNEEFKGLTNVFKGKIISLSLSKNRIKLGVLAGESFELHCEFRQDCKELRIGSEIWIHITPEAITII
ncbi:MAG: ABC transporter ATP-binding protein [Pseudomonadota bacterium]